MTTEYEKMLALSREARMLEGIYSHLGWDAETYMPEAAGEIRSEQRKLLAGIIHQKRTNAAYRRALHDLENTAAPLSDTEKVVLKEWQRDFRIATALPKSFVENFAKLTSDASVAWKQARQNNNFKIFAPWLKKIVHQCRIKAEKLGYQEHPYDAILDLYEPYIPSKELTPLFNHLRRSIVPILAKITTMPQLDDQILKGRFCEKKQLEFSNDLLQAVGFDMAKGRLDISTHPFSNASHPTDSRITTRLDVKDAVGNILTILHEFGHALYEQNLPASQYGSPLGEAISNGIHESQSRFWETRIGLSKPFWSFCLPLLRKHFPEHFSTIHSLDIWKAVNKVQPSLIRVEADEVTYTLHVILRYELEMELFAGTLKVEEVPEAWNAKMKELLNVTPKNDSEGCLQDIHWSLGAFGYFPSYSLGNLYAAQLFQAFERDTPRWQNLVAEGQFTPICNWLKDNIHQYGKTYTAQELLQKLTGSSLSAQPFIDYISHKYFEVYSL